MDDFQLEETGANAVFELAPDVGTNFHLSQLVLAMADAFSGSVVDGTMPGISYNSFLGLPAVPGGINLSIFSGGELGLQFTLRQVSDFLDGGSELQNVISDGTNTYMNIIGDFEDVPIVLKDKSGDKATITLTDVVGRDVVNINAHWPIGTKVRKVYSQIILNP